MKQKTLISMLLLSAAMAASAEQLNAVRVLLKSGTEKCVLFENQPRITTNATKQLVVTSSKEEVNMGDVSLVQNITAVYYDPATGIFSVTDGADGTGVEFFDLNGMKVRNPQKGQIYIIKTQGKTFKQRIKK